MAISNNRRGGAWIRILLAFIVAAAAVAIFYYIGWFDNNTHVDTPAGDNVEQQYAIDEADAAQPGEADWQNADGQTLRELITEPESQTTTAQ